MKKFKLSALAQVMVAAALVSPMSVWADLVMRNITPVMQNESRTELRFDFNEQPPAVQAYQIDNPLRLVVDFPKTKAQIPNRFFSFNEASIAGNYSVIDNTERTRVVFALDDRGTYATRVEGNALFLSLSSASPTMAARASVPKYTPPPVDPTPSYTTTAYTPPASTVTAPMLLQPTMDSARLLPSENTTAKTVAAASAIQQINFRGAASEGAGDVIVNMRGKAPIDVNLEGSKIVVKFLGTKLPDHLRRRMDVADFATPIRSVDSFNEGSNGVMVIQTNGVFEHKYYQTDDKFTLTVKRPDVKTTRYDPTKPRSYKGKPLSLSFQDMEVRQVLQIIAEFTNQNLVASDSIKDKITLELKNVPWDQALDIILKTKGLAKRENGNVILVAPAEELAKIEKSELQAQTQQEQLAPLQTEYIQLSYAKAADVINLIAANSGSNGNAGSAGATTTSSSSAGTGGGDDVGRRGLLSTRGMVSVDGRTNTIIVQDTAERIDEIRMLISKIDVPVQQVMIEARIVRATDSFSKELGVKWGILSQGTASNNNVLLGGSETTLYNLRKPEKNDLGGYTYTIDRPQNLNVDMGVSGNNVSRIALGLINMSDMMIDLELSALQSDGKGEVIATPKVLTMDKQKARVAAGQQIPYTTVSTTGVAQTSFKNAELSLEVTPSITPDGRIGMELFVNSDSAGAITNGGVAINTNRIQTNVLVENGQTVVLGGIYQTRTQNDSYKTPFLGDLPVVGRLFRKDVRVNDKQELLIFVTPRLVKNTGTMGK